MDNPQDAPAPIGNDHWSHRLLDRVRNQRQSITTPAELQAAEQAIIEATDKLAALMTGLKIQQALDSDDLKEKADQLVQAMPGGLKN